MRALLATVALAALLPLAAPAQQSQQTAGATAAQTADVTVKVENVATKGGNILLALYAENQWAGRHEPSTAQTTVPAVAGETVVTLHGIAPGDYGIKILQDENGNGKMDFTGIGLPEEPYGFSRDAKPGLAQPSFDEVKITLAPGNNSFTIHLQGTGDSTAPAR